MNTIKCFLISIAAAGLIGNFGSCNQAPDPPVDGAYIQEFVDPEWPVTYQHFLRLVVDEENRIIRNEGFLEVFGETKTALDVDEGIGFGLFLGGDNRFGLCSSGDEGAAYFKKVREIGDTNFSGPCTIFNYTVALLCTIDRIEITCDKDYDSNHPAGSSLNDLFDCFYQDLYGFVKSGYRPESGSYRHAWRDASIPQSVIRANPDKSDILGKRYIDGTFYFLLLSAPSLAGEYTFNIKMSLSNGVTIDRDLLPITLNKANN